MRNQPSSPETSSKSYGFRGSTSPLSSKSVRFRFPFKQKPSAGVSLTRSQTISTDSPSGSYGGSGGGSSGSGSGFLGLRKHFKASSAGGSNIMQARYLRNKYLKKYFFITSAYKTAGITFLSIFDSISVVLCTQ